MTSLLFLLSCATNQSAYRDIDINVNAAFYERALDYLDIPQLQNYLYPPRNEILFFLDRGMVRHYAGLWAGSVSDLSMGEALIESAFSKSITQEIGSYILNDNVKEYPGEDYEDLYINVFNALNFYFLDDTEAALVEVRRVNEKLRFLAGKYEKAVDKVVSSDSKLGDFRYAVEASRFSNSALARYLSLLFYRSYGYSDNARIDLGELYRAYDLAPDVYNHRPPSHLYYELSVPAGKARLNVIGFTGLSPVKEEVSYRIPLPLPFPNNSARLSLPHMIDRPSDITHVEIVTNRGQRFYLELIEDLGRVSRETFKSRYGLIVLKTAARAIAKSVTSAGAAAVVSKESGNNVLGSFIGLIGRISADLSENADIRVSRYFPGRAYVGGINLDPGVYTLRVNYYGRRGLVASEERSNVQVSANRLNLVEFVCLK